MTLGPRCPGPFVATRVLAVGLVALFASVGDLRAQAPSLESRVDARTLELVTPLLAAAERDALPVGALRAKVLEGAAKNRPPELIAQVVGQFADDLRATRDALRVVQAGAPVGGGELVAATLARQQGIPIEALAELWVARRGGQTLEIPVTVLSELVRRGVPVADAAALMGHILGSGVPLDRAALIPGRLDGATRPGVAPPEALERALRDLDIPAPPRTPGPPPGGPASRPPGR